ncbi:hypothetical protein [Geodermatophilus sp. DSM 45219]|uniref:hypothetical protein n=1 Tax=Geodermatophilus sp. DSM 45219 TaxID=1881103 RepID=UPI0015A41CAE|nr:hypothetical protein [Geodermatophilus sp. DSM 45219]
MTRVLGLEGRSTPARRNVLGVAGDELVGDLMDQMDGTEGFDVEVEDPITKAPAVQILPVATLI